MTTKGTELPDTIQAIEYFFEQGMTDGLPVVPPTQEAVEAFLEAGGLAPEEVLGTRESRNWVVTAQKVAVNAVMAGCKAEYAPVVAAAVRGMMKPNFNLSGISETTSGMSTPMVVVKRANSEEAGHQLGVEFVRPRVAGELDDREVVEADIDERAGGNPGFDGQVGVREPCAVHVLHSGG